MNQALAVSPEVSTVASDLSFAAARLKLARASRFLTEFEATTGHAPIPGLDNPNDTPDDRLFLDPDVRNRYDKFRLFNQLEVELLQPVFTWGELSGNIRAAGYGMDVDQARVDEKSNEVALRTGELYYALLLALELERLIDETGDIVDQAKEEIDRLLLEGAEGVDDADLFQVLITEQEFKKRVVEVEEKLLTAQVAMQRQLLLPQQSVVVPSETILEPLTFVQDSLQTYLDSAIQLRPEMNQARDGLQARDALVATAKSDYYPKVFLGARYRFRTAPGRVNQPSPFHSDRFRGQTIEAGLGLRQKLNFHLTRAKVEQATAEKTKVEHQLSTAEQLVQFEVEEAYRNLTIARAALESQDEALRLSREWLQTESINFDLDLGDTENLVRAVQANLKLRAEAHEAVYNHNVAVLRLLSASGQLLLRLEAGMLVVN